MNIINNFIVFEGCDGAGTTTQLKLLTERFKKIEKIKFSPAFEPTDGYIGRLIRLALKKEFEIKPETLAMLFAADRNEHLYGANGIIELIKQGYFTASDRYALSSLVYQGIECGDELPGLLNWRFPAPELTFFFDIDPKTAIDRMKSRKELEIYEYLEFQEKVREKYHQLIKKYRENGARVEILNGAKPADELSDQVWSMLSTLPIFNV